MSLFTLNSGTPDWYFVSLINSKLISLYVDNFINNTSHFQINDARQLPVIIPSKEILKQYKLLFCKAINVKIKQFECLLSNEETEKELKNIQTQLDDMVNNLYSI